MAKKLPKRTSAEYWDASEQREKDHAALRQAKELERSRRLKQVTLTKQIRILIPAEKDTPEYRATALEKLTKLRL